MIYSAGSKGPYTVAGYHDPDSIRTMVVVFRPATRTNATVYYKRGDDDYDIMIPSTFTGVYYKVAHPGVSAASPPTMSTEIGSETTDGTTGLIWESVAYNMLPPSIDVSSVTFSNTNSVTVSATSNTTSQVQFTIDVLPVAAETAGTFNITLHVVLSNGDKLDVTLKFTVGER